MVPNTEQCYEIMEKYRMLENIRAHSIMVQKVAYAIASGNNEAGIDISIEKVNAGALMHDIGKTLCLNSNRNHAEEGRKICVQNGLKEIADIVGEHIRLNEFESDNPVNEKEIIYYADKRVNHDKIVSIQERLDYLIERYGKGRKDLESLIILNINMCKEVEKKLFLKLDFQPEDLSKVVR